ncbi:MAG: substrate-binding domain-containing protein, partial [Verrucomicrobiae bacterium]|nr:substrate-binding domain-containing protein [Verrucomicrobiae bacterium]
AVEWFVAHGRRRVGLLWGGDPSKHYWYPARREGYERAMLAAGLSPRPTLSVPEWQPEDVTAELFDHRVRQLIGFLMETARESDRPDALLCYTDYIVPYVAVALERWGVTPNRDIWLGGYDNYALELNERQFTHWLPLITVDKRNWDMGVTMAELLFDRIDGQLPAAPQTRVVPPKLVEIGST